MEKQEKRISRVERNSKKYRHSKKNAVKESEDINNSDYKVNDDKFINTSKERVRRTERNKRKKRERSLIGNFKRRKIEEIGAKYNNIKITAIGLIILGILIMLLGFTLYFKSHFYLGTSINCLNVSGKSIEDVEEKFKNNIADYKLSISGRNNIQQELRGCDIGLVYDENKKSEIEDIKKRQNNDLWIKTMFSIKKSDISNKYSYESSIISYDNNKLVKVIDEMDFFKDENIKEPENAYLKYDGKAFVINKETQGTKVNKEKVYDIILKSISSGKNTIDLDKEDCYEKPLYTADSSYMVQAMNLANQYKDFKIKYEIGKSDEDIYGDTLLGFLNFDDGDNVLINKDKVSDFVNNLCQKYNTYGISHNFTTSYGNKIIVNGGDYGYTINESEEINQIISDIEGKKEVSREPIYSKKALGCLGDDIGNTYVEVDMGRQYLWFYKDGKMVAQGGIVTGNVYNGTATPEGVYSLKYKAKDTFLVGEGYKSHVNYWMPFNNNIGIHDASWRNTFGGKIYLNNGSHGCVNVPYKLAESIYNNIDLGIPVICYN